MKYLYSQKYIERLKNNTKKIQKLNTYVYKLLSFTSRLYISTIKRYIKIKDTSLRATVDESLWCVTLVRRDPLASVATSRKGLLSQ